MLTLQLSLLWPKSFGLTSLRVTKGSNKHPWDKYTELKAKIIWAVNALLSINFKTFMEKNENSSKSGKTPQNTTNSSRFLTAEDSVKVSSQ